MAGRKQQRALTPKKELSLMRRFERVASQALEIEESLFEDEFVEDEHGDKVPNPKFNPEAKLTKGQMSVRTYVAHEICKQTRKAAIEAQRNVNQVERLQHLVLGERKQAASEWQARADRYRIKQREPNLGERVVDAKEADDASE